MFKVWFVLFSACWYAVIMIKLFRDYRSSMPQKQMRNRSNVLIFRPGRPTRSRRSGLKRAGHNPGRGSLSFMKSCYGLVSLAAVVALYAGSNQLGDAVINPVAASSGAETIVGRASVIDGDTLAIRGRRIRLHGIDAPESGQICQDEMARPYRCGQRAALMLDRKIGRQNVYCHARGSDRYGRMIAVCEVNGVDLNGWLVAHGWAVAYTRYSSTYVPQQVVARLNRRGIWSGSFELPEKWRRRRR
jgi:endonuclease YncB( thermonuclease family)